MTQIKRSGILMYFDMKPVLERLSDHEVKELLLAILDYGENGVVPEFHSATLACFWPLLASAWTPTGNAISSGWNPTAAPPAHAGPPT